MFGTSTIQRFKGGTMIFLKFLSVVSLIFIFTICSFIMINNGYDSYRIHMTTLSVVLYAILAVTVRYIKAPHQLKSATQIILIISLLTTIVFFRLLFWHAMTTGVFVLLILTIIDGWRGKQHR